VRHITRRKGGTGSTKLFAARNAWKRFVNGVTITAKEGLLPLPEGNTHLGFLFAYGETAIGVRRAHDALKFEITEMLPAVGL